MSSPDADRPPAERGATPAAGDARRRSAVLDAALPTFARFGYRKTSMEEVARAAHISRPGLYFLFSSKEALFRAAVTQLLERDLAAVERILADNGRPLPERLVGAFDQWAGRYVGPLARDVRDVVDAHPDLLGDIARTAPRRFEDLLTDALAAGPDRDAAPDVARTMISASIGLKHQASSREFFVARMRVAVELLTR
ncbi:putative TetR family transcriptional regulator [Actinacidiphila reveromycinica]|uniref:Putative TetR family transcriptional regulator n=1 Tax=Actinacidiphila reveromycinica TaxID=659352 RepID=A0A7U3UYK0_9ACTN|nr:TetR/AcrR family transcriptional regulator [Streptomyces sp. SN-593]BBB00967.1 putative TetR family transcriptional regulator [Streptomyces sp. SN-593]